MDSRSGVGKEVKLIKTVNKELFAALDSLEKEKGISKEVLFEALEVALISAYKRNFQAAPNVRVSIDRSTGEIKVFSQLKIVEEVTSPQLEVELFEARVYDPRCQIGDEIELEVTPKEFGRIAAQTAKQVVIQRIREAERELIYESYVDRTEEVINGVIRRFEQRSAFIDLGKVEAILPAEEQIPHERYKQGERVKAFIMEVKKTSKGPQVIVSRTHTGFLKRLFEQEVPEIFEGIVEIKAVAREPGNRSKLAVWSKNKDIDPVGACVGPRGSRVQTISNQLKGEKIDIIKWDEEAEAYIASALSPAKVAEVELHPENKTATVIVPDNQLSLAIGKEGQNARLSAKITGWKIDICSETQIAERRLASLGIVGDAEPPDHSSADEQPEGALEAAPAGSAAQDDGSGGPLDAEATVSEEESAALPGEEGQAGDDQTP